MSRKEYCTKLFIEELGELNEDDKEVLNYTLRFDRASSGIFKLL